MTERPDRATVESWFANGHTGVGFVTGAVSRNLEMLELEGRAIDEGVLADLMAEADRRGLTPLLNRVLGGYTERTPSGGLHTAYYCTEPVDPNQPLARRPATDAELEHDPDTATYVLIETRGEGGQYVAAPSNGATHPTGRPWELVEGDVTTIATITADERRLLLDLYRTFDGVEHDAPLAPPPSTSKIAPQQWAGGTVGESWVDAVVEHLGATTTVRDQLFRHGWTDGGRPGHLCRPGVDHPSAIINASGRLLNFSTNTHFEAAPPAGVKHHTYDVLDVIAIYEHSGDRQAAARRLAEDTGILDAWKGEQRDDLRLGTSSTARLNVDRVTGEIFHSGGRLPAEFWTERPELAHIAQAADSRMISREALLLVVLVDVAAHIPPCIYLPGPPRLAVPNFIVGVIGNPGATKGGALDVADEVLPLPVNSVRVPIGTGEGLAKSFLHPNPDDEDRKVRPVVQHQHAVVVRCDEISGFLAQTGKSGETITDQLEKAWSGEDLGFGYANAEKRVIIPARSYRVVVVIGIAPGKAAGLFDDQAGGFPQRILMSLADPDPAVMPATHRDLPEWPGPLEWHLPDVNDIGRGSRGYVLAYSADLDDERLRLQFERRRNGGVIDELEEHTIQLQLKVAVLLAVLDQRWTASLDDWRLAGMILDAHRGAVRRLRTVVAGEAAARRKASNRHAAERAELVTEAQQRAGERLAAEQVVKVARRLVDIVRGGSCDHITGAQLRRKIKQAQRAHLDDALGHASAAGWLIVEEVDGQGQSGVHVRLGPVKA